MCRIQFSNVNRGNRGNKNEEYKREKHFIDMFDNRFETFKGKEEHIKAVEIFNGLLERIIEQSNINYNDVRFKFKRDNEFEKANGMVFFPNIVENYFRDYGKLIPLDLYLDKSVEKVKEHFKGQKTLTWVNYSKNRVDLEWNDSLIEGIKSRSINSYLSSVIEIVVEEYLRELSTKGILKNVKEVTIGDYLDRYFGVDVLIKYKDENGRDPMKYIHIARDSKLSRKYIKTKSTKSVRLKNNVWYERDFNSNGHTYFFFNETVQKQKNVLRHGNIYIPNPITLLEMIEDCTTDIDEDGQQYKEFAHYLVKADYTVDEIKNNFRKIKFDGVENE